MKHTFKFKQLDSSKALQEYAIEKFEKLSGYLLKDSHWHVFFSKGKLDYQVEVIVHNPEGKFKAKSKSADSLYVALDLVAEKLSKQFVKQKEKMQDHKKFERSKQGRLRRLNSYLEYDNSPFPNKKSA